MKLYLKKSAGFTLVELLVTTAIIAILAMAILPKIRRAIKKAKEGATLYNLSILRKAAQLYSVDEGANIPRLTGTGSACGPAWGTVVHPDFEPYVYSIPENKISPNAQNSRGVWNIVNDDEEMSPDEDGWRYGCWHAKVTINNGAMSTAGERYSSW